MSCELIAHRGHRATGAQHIILEVLNLAPPVTLYRRRLAGAVRKCRRDGGDTFKNLNFNLKCNTHNSINNNVLPPRKFVRGPRQANCPDPLAETAPIWCQRHTRIRQSFEGDVVIEVGTGTAVKSPACWVSAQTIFLLMNYKVSFVI